MDLVFDFSDFISIPNWNGHYIFGEGTRFGKLTFYINNSRLATGWKRLLTEKLGLSVITETQIEFITK